ncbi:MAG: Fe-S cluster assembly protein SufD [Kastovskya adunca ATA6-11-RM4]|jgi:Fe-S cluster assembly protein SufD|nr:Fe-S cluster assembly protein SufD [Kastovskya adunca ATA6-11-RM4]
MSIQASPSTEAIVSKADSTRDAYLAKLLQQCQKLQLQVLEPELAVLVQTLRDRASSGIDQLHIPTRKDEEWRFTDLSPLLQVDFQAPTPIKLAASAIETIPEAALRLVFVNGTYAPQLSATDELPEGVVVTNLAQLPVTHRSQVGNYLAKSEGVEDVFTVLNTSGLTDAAVVWVARNVSIETPIHLLFISAGEHTLSQPRCLVVAESGSSVTVVEEYTNHRGAEGAKEEEKEVYFANSVTEIVLEENAQVRHHRIQRESGAAVHIGKTAVVQGRDSRYSCNAITVGARLSRHNLETLQTGEQTETTLNGLTAIAREQLADTHSAIAYTKPYGTSHQLHKCIVDGKAQAIFNGKIFVPQAAQQTNAQQLNRNLLLSPKARVDTKPQLEITADNVKCSHGATVSQLEPEEVFYLQSRGLSQADARNLLIDAFAAEIIQQIPVSSLRETLTKYVAKMSK